MLDQAYGFVDKKESTYRKVGQNFDERTNEHVILIEYRVRRGHDADEVLRNMIEFECLDKGSWQLIREFHLAIS